MLFCLASNLGPSNRGLLNPRAKGAAVASLTTAARSIGIAVAIGIPCVVASLPVRAATDVKPTTQGSAAAALAPTKGAADTSTYVLKRIYKTGDINRYKLALNTSVEGPQPVDLIMTMIVNETTVTAKDSGEFTDTIKFEKALLTLAGADQDLTTLLPQITLTRGEDGKTAVTTDGGNPALVSQMTPMFSQMLNSQQAFLPKGPVKVGDSWKYDVAAIADTNAKGTVTLADSEMFQGEKALRLKITGQSSSAASADTTSQSEGYALVSVATGRALSMSMKSITETNGSKIVVHVDMNVLPDKNEPSGDPASK